MKRRTSPSELWTLNYRLLGAVMVEVVPKIRALNLETKEYFLLSEVGEHPNPAELARVLMLPKPSVTFMVKRLESAGYLRRELQTDDLRRFYLTLTPTGKDAMMKAREIFNETFGHRLSRLTVAQQAELTKLLQLMADG